MPQRPDQQDRVRINHQIRLSPVRLIDHEGNLIGVVTVEEARARADESGLDLVEVNPNIRPIVCRIMDYGRFKYDKQKGERKSKTAASDLKQIKFRPSIDAHDFETKVDKLRRFLLAGSKCRVTIMFRKREMRRPENGIKLMQRVIESLTDVSRADSAPTMTQEGLRDLSVTLNPSRPPVRKPEGKPEEPHPQGRLRRHERVAASALDAAAHAPDDDELPEDDSEMHDDRLDGDDDDDDDADDADDADDEAKPKGEA